MHERNQYKTPPDFDSLAHAYPPLQPHVIRAPEDGSPTIDFHDETAQRRLTQALLFRDFDIQLEIPDDRLCPPVPNRSKSSFRSRYLAHETKPRLNYVLWLQDVLSHSSSQEQPPTSIRGIDVGTGASAIYPLLACRLSPNWRIVATDVDTVSLASARANVDRNGLSECIGVLRADPTGPILFPLIQDPAASFDFSMCNPPFYASAEDAVRSAGAKALSPNAVCTGAEVEMITAGGEEGFVGRMVRESLALGERCRWYTSMLGKLSSLTALVSLLRAHSITNYALTELVQGHTRRWALAWSFTDARLPDDVARPSASALHRLLPPRTTFRQRLDRAPPARAVKQVLGVLSGESEAGEVTVAPLSETVDGSGAETYVVAARRDTWSRAARRKKAQLLRSPDVGPGAVVEAGTGTGIGAGEEGAVLVAHVWVEGERVGRSGESGVQLVVQWKCGHDAQAFESFASHVGRKIREALVSGGASHTVGQLN
ncbi:S-adenosyl-L-methionine dependent methyltransferase [Lactarius sanguifluus]|nr:S-adenosyl-L-methionine dependent methyltransferase [Lactarius sanguifluus]